MNRGAPLLIAVSGTDASGEPIWVVGHEWPEIWSRHQSDQSKEEQHLNRFRVDCRTLGVGDPYSDLRRGADPPDFIARTPDGREVGVECAQLLLSERAEVSAQFRQLRQRVLSVDRNRFAALRGHLVYVSFGDVAHGRPPRTRGEVNAFVAELERYKPFVVQVTELPEQLDPRFHHRYSSGDFTAAALTEEPDSLFYRRLGFELALGFSSRIVQSDAWALLEKLVSDHDRPGVDHLIVTAGGPTRDGFAFPSDSVLAEAVRSATADNAFAAAYVAEVYLHDWQSSAVHIISSGSAGASPLGRLE